jgi:hypothetical protein
MSFLPNVRQHEGLFSLAYILTFVAWLPAVVPIYQRRISFTKGAVYLLAPYVVPIAIQLAQLPD